MMAIQHRTKKHEDGAFISTRLPIHPLATADRYKATTSSNGSKQALHGHGQDDDLGIVEDTTNQWGDYDTTTIANEPIRGGAFTNHSISHVAALTREMKALEVRYFRTRDQLEKETERNHHVRQEMSKLRAQSTKTDRENAKLRNLLDRIQCEKRQLEQQAIHNREYAKKIEHKFFAGTPKNQMQTLVQCNVEMSGKIKELQRDRDSKADACASQQHELEEAQDKIAILKRALETRFEELQLNGSLHTGVLFELAKLQDHNAQMALQLGEERKLSKALEVKCETARARHVQLEEHLVVRETWLASLEQERTELLEKLGKSDNELQTASFEKATLLKFIQEQAQVKFQLEADCKRLQEAKMVEVENFHTKLQLQMDEKQKLHEQINELQGKLEKVQLQSQQLDKCWKDEQQITEELRTRQHELFLDIQRLQDENARKEEDLLAAKHVCRELHATIDGLGENEKTLIKRVDELEDFVAALEQEIVQRKHEEAQLRTAMETALRDLEVLSKQRNDAARAMNEAVTISASSLDEQQTLEAKVDTQRKQLEQLKQSKNLLQNAMLEQLSAVRKQLQIERLQRIEAEAIFKQRLGLGGGLGHGGAAASTQLGQSFSPVTPTPSFDSTGYLEESLQPLPPPEMSSRSSPLPPHHLAMLQRQHNQQQLDRRPSRSPSLSSCSSSSSLEDEDTARKSPPRRHRLGGSPTPVPQLHQSTPPQRTTMSIPSPSDTLSLLELAENL